MPGMPVEAFVLGRQLGDAPRQAAHGPGGVPVGPDAERVVALDLEQVGDLVEDTGDVVVMDGHG